jgi:hypothetical protein
MKRVIVTDEVLGYAPFNLGVFDAQRGYACTPEEYFSSDDCIVHFVLGYQSVAGENETTKQLLQKYDTPEIPKEYVDLEWEIRRRFIPQPIWVPASEKEVRDGLSVLPGDVDAMINVLRLTNSVISTPTSEYRYMIEEPVNG